MRNIVNRGEIRAFAGTPASFRYRAATLMERRIELAGEGERMPLGARITEVEIILPGWPATERVLCRRIA